MEKNIYPQVPTTPGVVDAPPSYNQTIQPDPSAPVAALAPMAMPPQPPQTFIIQNAVPIVPLGPHPCLVTCPSCHQQQMSKVRYETATKTHLFAALFCMVGLVCCVCVPYCMDTCKNPNHYCSNCNAYFGRYK